jgi:hypothetical protein
MDRAAKIVVVVLVVAASGFFIFSKIAGWHKNKLDTAVRQQQELSQGQTDKLEQKISVLEQELTVVKGQQVPEKKLAEVFGGNQASAPLSVDREKLAEVMVAVKKLAGMVRDEKELAAVLADEEKIAETLGGETKLIEVMREDDQLAKILRDEKKLAVILRDESKLVEILAEEESVAGSQSQNLIVKKKIPAAKVQPGIAGLERQIAAFFSYLDQQPYVQAYEFAGGSYLQYQIAVKNLSGTMPIVTGEMQSLYAMVRNVAHFYRVLGKKRVHATREMLQNESEIIESVMRTFYQWFTMDNGSQTALEGRPSPETMYEYAGYILNTLGGRSYLLRRSPKVRALVTYYCVLVLDRANAEELNSKGIDIRPYIKSSLLEVKNQIGLIHQKEYITRLSELNQKYYRY